MAALPFQIVRPRPALSRKQSSSIDYIVSQIIFNFICVDEVKEIYGKHVYTLHGFGGMINRTIV